MISGDQYKEKIAKLKPNSYLRVVEKRSDGIIVNGAFSSPPRKRLEAPYSKLGIPYEGSTKGIFREARSWY